MLLEGEWSEEKWIGIFSDRITIEFECKTSTKNKKKKNEISVVLEDHDWTINNLIQFFFIKRW